MKNILTLIVIWTSAFASTAQTGMFQWREHLPYARFIEVVDAGDVVYGATPFSMIRYVKEENFSERINTINALSDFGISTMNYDPNSQWAIVGYDNGNIDLVREEQTYNLPAIKNANISGSKKINKIVLHDSIVYICSDFGVVQLDIYAFEFNEAYYPTSENIPVYDIAFWNDSIYLATSNGLYRANKDNPFLIDNNSWEAFNTPFISDDSTKAASLEIFQDELYLIQDRNVFSEDTLWKNDGSAWQSIPNFEGVNLHHLKSKEDVLLISLLYNARVMDKDFNEIENIYQYTFGSPEILSFDRDSENIYWLADNLSGMVKAVNSFSNEKVGPEGPFSPGAYRMDYHNGRIGVAGGALTANFANVFRTDGFYVFEDENWTSFSAYNQEELNDTVFDFTCFAFDPIDENRFFAGSFSPKPLFKIENNNISKVYDKTNSTILDQSNNPGAYNMHDMQVDDNQTLWIANGKVEAPLLAMDINENWYEYNLGSQAVNRTTQRMYIDFYKNKWVAVRDFGLIAFNENGTLEDLTDDDIAYFSEGENNGNLPSKVVTDMEMDFDNHLWVTTDNGLAVIYNVEQIFDEDADVEAQRILIDDGINVEALLGGVSITGIDVDGANRKWISTASSGVFCLSPDGTQEIFRFTSNNSPLFTNAVLDVRVNQETGEVFFATENGLISFRADATYGDFEFTNISVFPNPVRPDFEGPITIQGVAFDSDVKIMDPSGRLVFQTTSNGGTIVWDGNLPNGTRASSGVYVVLVGEKLNKGKAKAKILFLN